MLDKMNREEEARYRYEKTSILIMASLGLMALGYAALSVPKENLPDTSKALGFITFAAIGALMWIGGMYNFGQYLILTVRPEPSQKPKNIADAIVRRIENLGRAIILLLF